VFKWRYRPIAAFHRHFPMLRCGPSKQPFVASAAFCRLEHLSAEKDAICFGDLNVSFQHFESAKGTDKHAVRPSKPVC
jgi:hypothetical protein